MNGTDVLVLANTGTNVSPVWTAVGSQRDCSFEETNEEIDMSSKDGRSKRVIAGRYASTLSLDALYVPDDTAYQALKTACRDGTLIKVQREEEAVGIEEALALITTMSSEFPDQDAATISIEFSIDDAWTVIGT